MVSWMVWVGIVLKAMLMGDKGIIPVNTDTTFSDKVLAWFAHRGRRNLPWQHPRTPYRVWLSEIMLQQTQVATVIPYFERFVQHFPTVRALALADVDAVMKLWAGLGYYARARNLHRCARQVCDQWQGRFPETVEELMSLPGIGRTTAGAIISQAHDRRAVILDGNVKRVLARFNGIGGWPGDHKVSERLWAMADTLTPEARNADYTQAIMDLGAMICKRSRPLCKECPVAADCKARQQGDVLEFPGKHPARRLVHRAVQVMICRTTDNQVLLDRRPPAGIWGGLWSLPECAMGQEPVNILRQRYGIAARQIRQIDAFTHHFTHFHLDIHPVMIEVKVPEDGHGRQTYGSSSLCAHGISRLDKLGMPAPIKRLLVATFDKGGHV